MFISSEIQASRSNGVINRMTVVLVLRGWEGPLTTTQHALRKAGGQQAAQPTAAIGIQALWFCQIFPISGGGGCTFVGPWAAKMGDERRCPETCLHTRDFQALPPCAQRGRQWGRRMGTGGTVSVWGALQMSPLLQEWFTWGPRMDCESSRAEETTCCLFQIALLAPLAES